MSRKEYALGACDHVLYEIKMFLFCIKSFSENPSDRNLYNALIESFAVHFRNLYSFFMKSVDPRYLNNVHYSDIKGNVMATNDNIGEDPKNANKKIAHIDRNRTKYKEIGWDYSKLYKIFRAPILDFINDPEILPSITEKDLLTEIKKYCDTIDCFINNSLTKGLVINKVDTTSGSVSITSSVIKG